MNTTDMHIPSNRVGDILRYMRSELAELYDDGEIRTMGQMLFEEYLGWDTAKLLISKAETINQSDLLKFHWAIEDLKRCRPIQHILGHTDFCGLDLLVGPEVLIPRPETAEMVAEAARLWQAKPSPRVLDICCGSGCIALALKKMIPQAEVYGADISPEALATARRNAERNALEVQYCQCDILAEAPALPEGLFDIIVSNPPYICRSERADMRRNVLDYEPEIALFVPDDDPLRFYRAIGRHAAARLSSGGILLLEINERYGAETCRLLQDLGYRTDLQKDLNGKERRIAAIKIKT